MMRVNRELNYTIRDKDDYKQTLFLAPAKTITCFKSDLPYTGTEERLIIVRVSRTFPADYLIGTPNPLFAQDDHCIELGSTLSIDMFMRIRVSFHKFMDHHDRMEASEQGKIWNQMFISEPPARRVAVAFHSRMIEPSGCVDTLYCGYTEYGRVLRKEGGVRIADIVAYIRREVENLEKETNGARCIVIDNTLEIVCHNIIDELCPHVQLVLQSGRTVGLKPGESIVPVRSGEKHQVRELVEV